MAFVPIIIVLSFDAFTEDSKRYEISILKSEDENLIIKAIYKNGLIVKEFGTSYTLDKLKNVQKYNLFDSIDDCILFISDALEFNKSRKTNIKLKEEGNKVILIIPIQLGKINEIKFELLEKEKTIKDSVDYALELLNKLYNENKELKTEIKNLKENTSSKLNEIYNENNELKKEIKNLKKDKEETSSKLNKVYKENNELKKEIGNLKKNKEETLSKLNKLEIEINNLSEIKQNNDIENLFEDSVIVSKNENEMIYNWINENNITCKLLYRASMNGDSSPTFHSCCDGKGPTITFIKTNDGKRIGAFTKVPWSSAPGAYKYDPDSFIFSLNDCEKLEQIKNKDESVYHNPNYGPTFVGGYDIFISNGCRSNSNSSFYLRHTYKKICSLKPQSTYNFQVDDYEVYSVQIN